MKLFGDTQHFQSHKSILVIEFYNYQRGRTVHSIEALKQLKKKGPRAHLRSPRAAQFC